MDLFSSSPLMESFPTSRFPSPNPSPSPTRTELDFPIEVDQSFNSSMSLSCADASPTPSAMPFAKTLSGSPLPRASSSLRRPDPVPVQRKRDNLEVPSPGIKRAFGQDLTNVPQLASIPLPSKGKMFSNALMAEGSIAMRSTLSNDEVTMPKIPAQPAFMRRETAPAMMSPKVTTDDMDIDSPLPSFKGSPAPSSLSASPGLGSFFCDSPGAPSALPPAKRRSLVSNSPASPASPTAKRALLARATERTQSSGMLFGAKPPSLAARRNQPYKRPSPLPSSELNERPPSASAYPILNGTGVIGGSFPRPLMTAPMRRAFSVCDQQYHAEEDEDDEKDSPSNLAHAEYARRHGQSYAPRVDGSPGFRPGRSSYTSTPGKGTATKGKKVSPTPGLPDFGDEMNGKILPCHKVREDGLARITPDTLEALLAGDYSGKMKRYHILDCRFDYEYAGGHIDGALHVKSNEALDELLLSDGNGLHATGENLPSPSCSGELGDGEQVVLVFHCEFSAKRAPTFAKHLRSRDRMLNNNLYPKVFYPEVYILEGGYCEFFKSRPQRCEPQAYVPMDDPKHFERRNSDLHDFRKFARTRSFTYGETQPIPTSRPNCPPLAFAAASAAVGRRQGLTITEEDGDPDLSTVESSPEIGSPGRGGNNNDSPCPRVVSLGCPPVFGSAKPRQLTRLGFHRVASYAGTTTQR